MYRSKVEAEEPIISAGSIQHADYWLLARAPANRVFFAAKLLRRRGLATYVPLQAHWKRVGRGRFKARKQSAKYPAFFNYLFIGFSRGSLDWWALFETGLVRTIIADSGGKPIEIPQGMVASIAGRQRRGEFDFRGKGYGTQPTVGIGDQVKVSNDRHILFGRSFRAEAVEDGAVRVIVEILGKKQVCAIALDDVAVTG